MWSTDYPHHGADWPYSRKVIDEQFHGVPVEERERHAGAECVELYGWSERRVCYGVRL